MSYRRCLGEGGELCDAWVERIESWSKRYRVLNDFTAMVMLVPPEDYKRFDIDRAAPSDILAFGSGGVELRAPRAHER